MGSGGAGVTVRVSVGVGEIVGATVCVTVGKGLAVKVGVWVANTVVRSRLTVRTEAKARKSRSVMPPPMIHGRQLVF